MNLLVYLTGRNAFMRHLEKEVASENLKFYVEVEAFRKKYNSTTEITTNELIDEASVIYSSYVDPKGSQPVNLPDDVAKKIIAIWEDSFKFPAGVNQWIFTDAQVRVWFRPCTYPVLSSQRHAREFLGLVLAAC
jgi:hypothetical protein